MLLLRVHVPDHPGALGAVATALGTLGADISLVEIVERSGGVGVNDFILDLPADQTVSSLVAACDRLSGVEVQWVRNYPRGGGIELDVELDRRMAADISRAAEILASAAPLVFRAEWSVLLEVSDVLHATFRSPGAPDLDPATARRFAPFDTVHRVSLEPGWLPAWAAHHAVVAPLSGQRALVVGRRGEPPFFSSELTRLAHLVGSADTTQVLDQTLRAHRTPVAAPLYLRDHEGQG